MSMRSLTGVGSVASLLGVLWLGDAAVSWGQKPPPPVLPNPQAPVLAMPMPLGMQRGTTLDLALTGTNLAGATEFWTGFPVKATIPSADKNGQDNSKLKVRLEVPATTPLGYYPVRLATTRGMSNVRLFCIDDLPQVLEVDTNRTFEMAQAVPVPCVVVGRADAEARDYFKITVAAGQRVSFEVLGRRLGSPIDPQLSIYSAKTKRELAHDNDSPGCQTDPRLTYVFKEAGDYLIEVKDVLNRGGADFVYRLRIGDFPLATVPIPMAAKRGSKVKIQFAGPQVEGVPPLDVAVPADPQANVVWVAPKGANGLSGWPVALAISDLDEGVEKEPNNDPAMANRINVPGAVTGRFEHSDDTDCYVFTAKKGQKLTIEAQTLELYSPTLVYMVLKNAKTKAELAKTNPQSPPPTDQRIDFTAAEDGDYLLEVQHLNFVGGPSEAYRLVVTPTTPGFEITLGIDRYDLAPGSFTPLLLQVNRKGYTGPIDVSVNGPAGLTGAATVKAGQASAALLVSAKADMPLAAHNVMLLAKATIDGSAVVQPITVKGPIITSLSGLPYPPVQLNHHVALAVKEKAPFALAIKMDPPESVPGIAAQVTIAVKRDAGFAEEIVLNAPAGLPANVPAPKLANIAKDKSELKFALDVNAKTPLGEYLVFLSGKAKVKDKEYSTNALPLALVVGQPFEFKIEPAVLELKPGDKGKLKITALRKGGYKGPITLDVRKLPANVTAGKAAIAMDQTSFEVEISAAANAVPGEKKDVDVNGTATALNNLQNASPAFTIRVNKK